MPKKEHELIKKGLLLGVGLAAYAQEKTERFVNELIKKGHLNKSEGKKLVRKIYKEADTSRKKLTRLVEKEVKKIIKPAKPPKKKAKRRKKK